MQYTRNNLTKGEVYYMKGRRGETSDFIVRKGGLDSYLVLRKKKRENTLSQGFYYHDYEIRLATMFEKRWLEESINAGRCLPKNEIKTESYAIY